MRAGPHVQHWCSRSIVASILAGETAGDNASQARLAERVGEKVPDVVNLTGAVPCFGGTRKETASRDYNVDPRHEGTSNMDFNRTWTLTVLVAALLVLLAVPAEAGSRYELSREQISLMSSQTEGVDQNVVVVKFAEGSDVRYEGGEWLATSRPDEAVREDLRQLEGSLADHGVVSVSRRIQMPEEQLSALRDEAQRRSGMQLADLSLYYELHLTEAPDRSSAAGRLRNLLDEINALSIVEVAYAAPIPEPTSIRRSGGGRLPLPTPDFTDMQGYLYEAPEGVEAETAWTYTGGTGADVKVIDIEFGWQFTHEDLKPPFFIAGDPGSDDHGTAVLGEVAGQHNGFGVNGISPDVEIGGSSINTQSFAGAVNSAAGALDPGDIYIIELHAIGPLGNYVPMEFWPDNFDAIQTASALGIICCEAAGNGTQNLDHEGYSGLFDRRIRNSGAIMCGAGTPTGLNAEWFSNYGSRVDLQGWGSSVTTTGYGDLHNDGPDATYTAGFNGTSSATPIVTGSVASLQGQAIALFGEVLSPALAQDILSVTGTPWAGDSQIGERPNLVQARPLLVSGFADLTVTVRDADTLLPLPDMIVEIVETGRLQITDGLGQVFLQMSAGESTLRAGSYFYVETDLPVTIVAGVDQDIFFDLAPAGEGILDGIVWLDGFDDRVSGATVRALDAPISPAITGGDGHFTLTGLSEGTGYVFLAGLVPGLSSTFTVADILSGEVTAWHPVLLLAEDFESSDGGYTTSAVWEWGTPSGAGPGGAFSGSQCWATNLSGYYPNYGYSNLITPTYPLAGAESILLSFNHWYWMQAQEDGGAIQVYEGSSWHTVTPIEGYDSDQIGALGNGPGFTGSSDGWVSEVFDLSDYASDDFQIRFRFGSGPTGSGPGWYIDDVALDDGSGLQAIEVEPELLPAHAERLLLSPVPNPSVQGSRFSFVLPASEQIQLTIHDAQGRLVQTLAEGVFETGRHQAAWDGANGLGQILAAGVYYARLTTESGRSETRPVMRIK